MNKLLERLNISLFSSEYENAYNKAVNETEIPCWLNIDYIKKINDETQIICTYMAEIEKALGYILKNPDLTLYAKILYYMLKSDKPVGELFGHIKLPAAPNGAEDALGYDLMGIFPLIPLIYEGYCSLKEKNIPEDILIKTYTGLDSNITASKERAGKTCLLYAYFGWMYLYARGYLLNIGRLNFELVPSGLCGFGFYVFKNVKTSEVKIMMDNKEIHKSGMLLGSYLAEDKEGMYFAKITETESAYEGYCVNPDKELVENKKTLLLKSEWQQVLSEKDAIISVHIPGSGKLDVKECELSYKMAEEVFKKAFPQNNLSAFFCESWLLAKELKLMLNENSNILAFKNKYHTFPIVSTGRDVFMFVFKKLVNNLEDINFDELPDTSSFTVKIKELYKNGGAVCENAGVILM